MRGVRVYISGRIKGVDDAKAVFAGAGERLRDRGYRFVNPFDCEPICTVNCPDTPVAESGDHYDCFMRGDVAAMISCDGLAMLPGWEASNGARIERQLAMDLGFIVRDLDDWLAGPDPQRMATWAEASKTTSPNPFAAAASSGVPEEGAQ